MSLLIDTYGKKVFPDIYKLRWDENNQGSYATYQRLVEQATRFWKKTSFCWLYLTIFTFIIFSTKILT